MRHVNVCHVQAECEQAQRSTAKLFASEKPFVVLMKPPANPSQLENWELPAGSQDREPPFLFGVFLRVSLNRERARGSYFLADTIAKAGRPIPKVASN